MGQMSEVLQTRNPGQFPSQTEKKHREDCNAIYMRSGRELSKDPTREPLIDDIKAKGTKVNHIEVEKVEVENEIEMEMPKNKDKRKQQESTPSKPIVKPYVPPLPFPNRLKAHKDEEQFKKFLDIFKKLHINIPFAEALAQMPTYLKYMKDILSKKRKVEDHATIALTEECSAIIQHKLPPKLKDPGSFAIPVHIGNSKFSKSLCDLGASINLMSLSIFRKLGLGEVKPTNMTLQLADRSVKYPYGIVEDILIKVGNLYFPVDFVVLDVEEDVEVPLILGRPFLATSKALIDMEEGVMIFRVGNEKVTFHVLKSIDYKDEPKEVPIGSETCKNGRMNVGKIGSNRMCGRSNFPSDTEPN